LEGERKTVTALFADIKGSTELERDLDPEEARAIVDPALKLMIEAVQRYDGYVVQSTGDGIFAIFGAPFAHEDHAQKALYASLRMQDELRQYSTRLVAEGGNPLQCRVGVNSGEVVVRSIATGTTKSEYTPIGHTTNLASRMQAVAPVGSIAVGEPTRKLCEGYFTLKALGPTRVKGLNEPVNVYEVTGLGPIRTRLQRAAGRGYARFVGRHSELDVMKQAARRAMAGHGQVVAVIGDAGVGKSRLVFEFKATSQRGWLVLDAHSFSHDKATAYAPLIDLLHAYFHITQDDDPRIRREKVAGKLTMLQRGSDEETLPYLFGLLGIVEGNDPLAQMDAPVRRRRTQDAVRRVLLRESLNQPLMLIFEDLHWIDDETQIFLDLLVEEMANARVLLVVNYRPEYTHNWGSKPYCTQLRLDPLGKESALQMLSALLGDSVELTMLKRLIIEKTEGNPLFMEEIVQALVEDGVLAREGPSVKLTKSMNTLSVPATVQAVLTARIDRLPAAEKELLQTLAVLGRKSPLKLVQRMTLKSDDDLGQQLRRLQVAEFIFEQLVSGDIELIFEHVLTQEVAYNGLLAERRKSLHERAGSAIEALYGDALDDHAVALANHFQRAGNAPKATRYLLHAGVVASRKAAFPEAVGYLSAGLELVRSLPQSSERTHTEWELLSVLATCLTITAGAGSSERGEVLMRMKLLGEQSGDPGRMLSAVVNRAFFHSVRNELAMERDLSKEAVRIAEQLGDPVRLNFALSLLGYSLFKRGELEAARTQLERALAGQGPHFIDHFIDQTNHSGMLVLAYLSWVQWMLGFPTRAVETSAEALRLVRKEGSPLSIAFALIYAAELHRFARQPDKTMSMSAEAMDIADRSGMALLHAQAKFEHGWSLAQGMQISLGVEETISAMAEIGATGAVASAWRAGPVAECWARIGHCEKGLPLLRDALGQVEATGEHFYKAELWRLLGELTLMADPSQDDQAEQAFDRALGSARAQHARVLELRAATSLARLLEQRGRRGEAATMIASAYGRLTEGFDTPDLVEAKRLMVRLGA
jgi:predicted ATPase/class 3 adenylate cyclase